MSPQEYKKQLQDFFTSLTPSMSEDEKLRRIDAFRRTRGVKKHIRSL